MHIVNEEPTMPSAFVRRSSGNYSHCPLKKRPVFLLVKDEDTIREDTSDGDNSEPENLSTKPEDLSWKPPTPPIGVAMISSSSEGGRRSPPEHMQPHRPQQEPHRPQHEPHRPQHLEPAQHRLLEQSHHHRPLEPLSLNTPATAPGEIAWPRPCYPPAYLPAYPYYYSPYERSSSPPQQQTFIHHPKPLYLPFPGDCGVPSPASSTGSAPGGYLGTPPTPEDLSSPNSVGSASSWPATRKSSKQKEPSPRYQCNFCNKSYSTYSGLSKHQQFHCSANEDSSAKKTFSCKYCEKVYVSLGALKMHIRTHTLPCKCKLCGKAFSRPWLLQGHIRTHTGEKPFTCQHCNRAFADRSNLRAHLQTHSEVKKYSCTTCSKTFSRMSLLTKHAEAGCPGSHHDEIFKHEYTHDIPSV